MTDALPVVKLDGLRFDRIEFGVHAVEEGDALDLRIVFHGVYDSRLFFPLESNASGEIVHNNRIQRKAWDAMPADYRANHIRGLLIKALVHELDEWLRIDDKQLVDPHPENKFIVAGIRGGP